MPDPTYYPQGGNQYPIDKLRDPESEGEIIAALSYDVASSEWILAPLHRSWYEDLLWTYGEHYLEWNQRTRRFQIRPVTIYVPRSSTNLILPKVEIGVSLFMDTLPRARYVPTTPDPRDRDAADAATGIIRYNDGSPRLRISQKKRDLASWVVICGTGYVQAIEDKANAERRRMPRMTEGPPDPETGQPSELQATDPQTGQPLEDEVVLTDEGIEVLSPFEVVPDWNARYPWEWQRYTHVRARTREWIGRMYGSEARDKVKPESASGIIGTMGYYQLKVLDIQMRASLTGSHGLPYGYGGAIADYRFMEDSAVVMTRYMLPDDKHPNGRRLVVAGGQLLENGDYPHGDRLNIFTFRWSVLPGGLFGFGMVRNLIMPQKRLNGIDTQVDYIRKTMGSPRILAHQKSRVAFDLSTSEPAHIYTHKTPPGLPMPQVLQASGADADAHRQREFILRDMEEISGIRNVLSGQNPPGVSAGISLEFLTEQAGKRFQPAIEDNREEFKRLYEMRIEIARQGGAWQYPREIPMIGEDGKIQSQRFQAADFTGSLAVDIEAVPITALSQALKKQTALDLINANVIDLTHEKNRDALRRLFGMTEFGEDVDLDRRRAEHENELLYAGQEVQVHQYEDNGVHLQSHIEATKSEKFLSSSPGVQDAFLAHIQKHILAERVVQAQMQSPPPEPLPMRGIPAAAGRPAPLAPGPVAVPPPGGVA